MTDILITSYYRLDATQKTIEYVMSRTTPGTFRLIIVDNGSSKEQQDWLRENIKSPHVLVLLNHNRGLQEAKNIGLHFVESQRYVDTDNDILVPALRPDWLTQLNGLMDGHPSFAAISLRPQILVGVGPIFNSPELVIENNVAGGSMRLMKTDVVRLVKGWENRFENRREEWEISGRLKKEGWSVGYARDLFCYHIFGQKREGLLRWGYEDGIDHFHKTDTTVYHDDMFPHDEETCVPHTKHNE